jgi:uncharacterized protein with HEPN domain
MILFIKDRETLEVVMRNFTIIGEASRSISEYIKEKYSNVDWKGIADFRNRIVHAYFEISATILWHIIKNNFYH